MSGASPQSTFRRFARFVLWTTRIFLVALVAVIVGLGMYTRTDRFRAWLQERAIIALHEVVRGEVQLGQINGSIWNGLVFHNLSVRDATGEVLQIPQATVTLKLLSQILLAVTSSTLRIDDVTIQSPTLRLVQRPEGVWNVSQLFTSSTTTETTPKFQFFINRIRIDNGSVSIESHERKPIYLHGITTEGRLAQTLAALETDIASMSFRAEYPLFPALTWEGGVTYKRNDSTSELSLHRVDLRTPDSHLQVSGTIQNLNDPLLALAAEVPRLSATELRSLFQESPLQQDLSGSVQLSGPLQNPTAKGDFQAPDGKATVIVKADLQQSPPHYEATVDLNHIVIDKVVRVSDVRGEISGHVEFSGSDFDAGKTSFALQPRKLVVQDRAVGNSELSGTVVNRRITATGKTDGQIGQVQWNGWVELGPPIAYKGTIIVRDCSIEKVAKQSLPIGEAIINADAQLSGHGATWQELITNAHITILPSRVGSMSNIHGNVVGSFQQQQATIEHLSLVANDTTVQLQGQIEDLLGQSPRAAISYNAQTQDVAPWLGYAGSEGHGAISLTGNATGPLHELTVTGTASGSALRWQQTTIQNGTATYRLQSVGRADARGAVTASVQELEAGETWRNAAVDVAIVRVQPLELQTTIRAEGRQVQSLRAQVHVQQKPTQWDVGIQDLTLQLPNGVWTQPQPALLNVGVGQGAQVTADRFALQRGVHAISVSGTLQEHGSQNIQVQVTQLPLADLRPFVTSLPPVDGDVNASLHVTGTLASPEATVDLTTSPLIVHDQSYAGLTGHAVYQDEKITLSAVFRQDTAHTLALEGTLPVSLHLRGEQPLSQVGDADFRLHSDGINMAPFGLATGDEVRDIEGITRIDLSLRGPLSALHPSGTVQLREGRARLKDLEVSLKDIEAEVGVTPEFLELRQFTLSAGQGKVTGNGRLALQQYTPGDLALTFVAKQLQVVNTRRYKAVVSGQITCSGSLETPVVQGTLQFEDIALRPAMSLLKSGLPPRDATVTVVQTEQDLTVAASTESPSGELASGSALPPTPGLLQRLAVDLTVKIPRDTWVHMHEGSIELTGKLQVKKTTNEEPTLSGTIDTVRGWYAFHGRKFRVERGQILFPGTLPVDPYLDVVARYTIAPYDVDVVLGGTARTPTLELRSNPVLEEADILSVLIFGKPANGLSNNEQASLQTQAIQATAGYVASGLRRSIANKLGLDNLEFDMGQNIGQEKVTVGKYVLKDVYVSTSQQLGEKQEREVSVEYQIDRRWQVKGSTTSRGTSGVDIFWQKRY